MDKISFLLKSDTLFDATITTVSSNVIKIVFENEILDEEVLLSGFNIINEHNNKNMTDDYYHAYNTIYLHVDENTFMLSNDGSVYVTPEPTDTDDMQIAPHVPTIEEVKSSKIEELSAICNTSIINGVDIEINGVMEHFSYNDEDQVNIKELFDLAVQSKISMYYHADGQSCKLYTVEQIVNIYAMAAMNKMHHITYFNQMKMYISSLDDKDIISSISYGDELTGVYLDTYKAAMSQAQHSMDVLFSSGIKSE